MALSSSLISQLVKTTNDSSTKTSTSSTVYGTVKYVNNSWYVQPDGSEQLVPVAYTVSLSIGDRVTVSIGDHTAIVTGNLTDQSASSAALENVQTVVTDLGLTVAAANSYLTLLKSTLYISGSDVEVEDAVISIEDGTVTIQGVSITALDSAISVYNSSFEITDGIVTGLKGVDGLTYLTTAELTADHETVANLDATYATITNLNAAIADIESAYIKSATVESLLASYIKTDELDASVANILKLTTSELYATVADLGYVTADTVSTNYLRADFANLTLANAETFFATVGILTDMTVGDASITGTLTGVTIYGDCIVANSIVAESLVLKGEDGLYYAINATSDSLTTSELTDEKYQQYIDGSVLVAESITATQIAAGTITANEIAAQTITGNEIAALSITADKLSVATLSAITADLGAVTAGSITITDDDGTTIFLADMYTKHLIINTTGLTLDADGNATFSGILNAASGTFAGTIESTALSIISNGYYEGYATTSRIYTQEGEGVLYITSAHELAEAIICFYPDYLLLSSSPPGGGTSNNANISLMGGSGVSSTGIDMRADSITVSGEMTTRNILPYATTTYNLGSSSYRYNYIYTRYANIAGTITLSAGNTTESILFDTPNIVLRTSGNASSGWNVSFYDNTNSAFLLQVTTSKIMVNKALSCSSSLTVSGSIYPSGNVVCDNAHGLYVYDTSGTARAVAYLNSDNNLVYGNGSTSNDIYIGNVDYTNYMYLRAGSQVISYSHMLVRQSTALSTSNTGRAFQVQSNASNTWADSDSTNAIFVCGCDSTSRYIRSYPTYTRTSSSSANVYITSSGTFARYSSSASRYKNTINYFTNADYASPEGLAKRDYTVEESDYRDDYRVILKFPVVQFHYNVGYMVGEPDYDYDKYITGFIAEDIAALCPACATYTEDGQIEAWNHMEMIPRMVACIQDICTDVTLIDDRVTILEAQLAEAQLEIVTLKKQLQASAA